MLRTISSGIVLSKNGNTSKRTKSTSDWKWKIFPNGLLLRDMLERFKPPAGLNNLVWRCLNGMTKDEMSDVLGISKLQYQWMEQFGLKTEGVFEKMEKVSQIPMDDWRARSFRNELLDAAQNYESTITPCGKTMSAFIQTTINSQVFLDYDIEYTHDMFGDPTKSCEYDYIFNELSSTLKLNWKMINLCLKQWINIDPPVLDVE